MKIIIKFMLLFLLNLNQCFAKNDALIFQFQIPLGETKKMSQFSINYKKESDININLPLFNFSTKSKVQSYISEEIILDNAEDYDLKNKIYTSNLWWGVLGRGAVRGATRSGARSSTKRSKKSTSGSVNSKNREKKCKNKDDCKGNSNITDLIDLEGNEGGIRSSSTNNQTYPNSTSYPRSSSGSSGLSGTFLTIVGIAAFVALVKDKCEKTSDNNYNCG